MCAASAAILTSGMGEALPPPFMGRERVAPRAAAAWAAAVCRAKSASESELLWLSIYGVGAPITSDSE